MAVSEPTVALLWRATAPHEHLEQILGELEMQVLPDVERAKGSRGALLLWGGSNDASAELLVVSFWDSQVDADAYAELQARAAVPERVVVAEPARRYDFAFRGELALGAALLGLGGDPFS